MLFMFTLFGFGVHAGVYAFPPRAAVELRLTLQAHLNGKLPPADLKLIHSSTVDMVTMAVTALDEIDRVLTAGSEPAALHRITKTLDWILELPLPVRPNERERDDLRRALRPFLQRSKASKMYHQTVKLYRRFDLWDDADADFVIAEITEVRNLIDRYDLIRRLAPTLSDQTRDDLGHAILGHRGHPLVRFALLDEIGLLPAELHAPTFMMVRNALSPVAVRRAGERERAERRLYLRLLERWQTRFAADDPAVRAAFAQITQTASSPVDRAFADQFRRGRLALNPTDAALAGADPLGLTPKLRVESESNVILFADCQSLLLRRRGRR